MSGWGAGCLSLRAERVASSFVVCAVVTSQL